MTANLLNGKQLAEQIRQGIKQTIDERQQAGRPLPGLAVVLVGQDPASEIYVANKRQACVQVGIQSFSYNLPETTSEQALLHLIHQLNANLEVNGILVQMPLPASIDKQKIIEAIDPLKDVDGFHPYNIGRLVQRQPLLRPCTPWGMIQLLKAYEIPLRGKHAVVVGASNIVGRPMGLELLLAASTVTVCHQFTHALEKHVRQADILVVAVGKRNIVQPEWLHDQQVVLDVGMHRLQNGKVQGDLDFEQVAERVAWITPVPGGVGPMTIATLLQNTLFAAQHQFKNA